MKKLIIDLLKINPELPHFKYLNIKTEADLEELHLSKDGLLDFGGNLVIDIEDENLYNQPEYRKHYDLISKEYLTQTKTQRPNCDLLEYLLNHAATTWNQ